MVNHNRSDQFAGCLLGLATGDALGAPHEGGLLERLVWRMIGKTSDGCLRWTDDTQMALDLARSLLEDDGLEASALAGRFATSYRWSRGYGPSAAKVLQRIRRGDNWTTASRAVYPGGSFGNGAAMRAPVLALFYPDDRDALLDAARVSATVTHAHPLGIEGAVVIGLAAQVLLASDPGEVCGVVLSACQSQEMKQKLDRVDSWLTSRHLASPKEVAEKLGNGITALTSCPTALYAALRHLDSPFDEMMQFVIACGGDVDTIGSMAGVLWGIANGPAGLPAIPLEARGELEAVAKQLYERR